MYPCPFFPLPNGERTKVRGCGGGVIMDKIIIIYFSITGNTERLAHLAGDFLKEKGKAVDYFKLPADQTGSFLRTAATPSPKR